MSPRWLPAAAIAALAIAAASEAIAGAELPQSVGDALVGALLLTAGATVLGVRRAGRSGALLLASGLAWLAGTLFQPLLFLHRGPLVHLVLGYPRGRIASRIGAVVVGAAYVWALVPVLARSNVVTLAMAGALVVAAAVRMRRASGTQRRALTAALGAALLLAGALALAVVGRIAGVPNESASLWIYDVAVGVTGLGLAIDLRWGRWGQAAARNLAADLGPLVGTGALRDRLARALGDPELELGVRRGRAEPYVDEHGQQMVLPSGAYGRTATLVSDRGEAVAVLVHDRALPDDPELLSAAVAALRLAASNARLDDDLRAAVVEVAASRRRLVEAGIEQRRRLEAELREAPERRLAAVSARLGHVAGVAGSTGEELQLVAAAVEDARVDLRRFAHGVHPLVLTEHGLARALADAARLMPIPVELEVPEARFAPDIEASVYFLCTEALANVAKHARAGRAAVCVSCAEGGLAVTVSDDGVGGAHFAAGGGLSGLSDRIAAFGGGLGVESPVGRGTHLEAVIPV